MDLAHDTGAQERHRFGSVQQAHQPRRAIEVRGFGEHMVKTAN
jgi:hypothetical protein